MTPDEIVDACTHDAPGKCCRRCSQRAISEMMRRAAAAAVAAEREACAKIAEARDGQWLGNRLSDTLIQRGREIAAAIRARKP